MLSLQEIVRSKDKKLYDNKMVVDEDYRGEYIVALHNDSNETRVVNGGDRIAQLVVIPYYNVDINEVNDLPTTERGAGGFGSTGK